MVKSTAVTKPHTAKPGWLRENWLRVVVHIGVWGPLLWLVWRYFNDDLGADPVTTLNNVTGRTAMILLLLCLACTPVYIVTGWNKVIKVRRALGVYAFMYAGLHFLNFIGLDYALNFSQILRDGIQEKPYIIVGFTALVILLALALTSTRGSMKRLKKNWPRLHWLIYPAGILVITHFLWQAKAAERSEPLVYATILAALLIVRLPPVRKAIVNLRTRGKRAATPKPQVTAPMPTKPPVVKVTSE